MTLPREARLDRTRRTALFKQMENPQEQREMAQKVVKSMAESTTLIQKNALEVIRIAPQVWRGQPMIDVRIWFPGRGDGSGELKPSPKGITFNARLLPQVTAALDLAGQAVAELVEKAGTDEATG